MPDVARPTPDIAGFAEAQDTKRQLLGSDVTFLGEPVYTWPPNTPINPDSGMPFDASIDPVSVQQSQDVVRCGVFFKAVNRGGAAQAALGSPAGWEERSRIFAIAPVTARSIVEDAVEFVFHGDHFKVDVIKEDEIVLGYKRMLVYASRKQEAGDE